MSTSLCLWQPADRVDSCQASGPGVYLCHGGARAAPWPAEKCKR